MREISAGDELADGATGWLHAAETRRGLLRRSGLLAGIGITALLVGCSRGDDDDDDTESENSGLDEGAEDPGEAPGADEESGVQEGAPGELDATEESEDEGDD